MDWMSTKQLPPPVGTPLIVTVERDTTFGPRRAVVAPVYDMRSVATGEYSYFERGDENAQIGPEYFHVVAWTRYPLPYEG